MWTSCSDWRKSQRSQLDSSSGEHEPDQSINIVMATKDNSLDNRKLLYTNYKLRYMEEKTCLYLFRDLLCFYYDFQISDKLHFQLENQLQPLSFPPGASHEGRCFAWILTDIFVF